MIARAWVALMEWLVPADLFDVDLYDLDWMPDDETVAAINRLEAAGD